MLAEISNSFWLPPEASTVAAESDGLFRFIMYLSYFFFFLITILLVYFVIKYRHRKGQPHKKSTAGHSTTLELTWTIIPTVIVVIIYIYGFRSYLKISVEPPDALTITATGRMWNWSFTYPNDHVDNELHVPSGKPVRVFLNSADVIHSLYFPDFRVKKDVVPGRFNHLWFQSDKPGEYDIYCAGYCGENHSTMRAKCIVEESQESYDKWLAKVSDDSGIPPVELGEKLRVSRGCNACHSVDGSAGTGPTWKDLYGSEVPLQDGTSCKADDEYIKESIQFPQAKIVRGFTSTQMSAFDLKPAQITGLIAYMKKNSKYAPQVPTSGTAGTTQPGTGKAQGAPETKPLTTLDGAMPTTGR